MPFKLSPRLNTFDYRGFHRYFLTICCDQRHRAFTTASAVERVVLQMRRTAIDERFAVPAYCFMPDHLHALVEGVDPSARFTEFVRIFKQRSAFEWKQATGGPLWQRGYFERVLRADEDTSTAARYMLANPVRAGLVAAPADYPFLGSLTMDVKHLIGSVQVDVIGGRRT